MERETGVPGDVPGDAEGSEIGEEAVFLMSVEIYSETLHVLFCRSISLLDIGTK